MRWSGIFCLGIAISKIIVFKFILGLCTATGGPAWMSTLIHLFVILRGSSSVVNLPRILRDLAKLDGPMRLIWESGVNMAPTCLA